MSLECECARNFTLGQFLCLGVWGILSALVIAVLSYFLHRCSGRSWSYSPSSDCVQSGTQISETNVDFLNVDISGKDIVDEARQVKCDCSMEVLEWTLFEVIVVALLLLIFCYLSMTDGASHFLRYLKKYRNLYLMVLLGSQEF